MKRLVAVLAVVLLLFAGCLAAPHTRGAVYAVDLGSSYFKMAAPKFNSSIDIVLNEQSRRKTPMMVGFRKGNRYVAEEAKSMAGRFPTLMLPSVNRLVGVSVDEARRINKELLLDLAPLTENKKRGVADLDYTATDAKQQKPEHRGDVPDVFSPEELFSMIVRYTEEVTTADVGEKATSTLLVVPHFYSDRQREALLQGAEMAGVNVLGITHSLTAAAFQFGISQGGFGNDTVVVAIVDMGATKTEIGVFHFGPHPPVPNGTKSDVRMAESLGIMTTLAVESLPYVGGTSIDLCIAEKILDARLVLARGPKHSILKAPADAPAATLATRKFSLMRAANSLKEALSVNPSFSVVVEAADADGQEFEVTATRDELTSLCFGVFDDVAAAVATAVDASRAAAKRLFNDSTLEIDIAAVELVGGTTRIPAINAALTKGLAKTFATSPPIGRRLNADEAVALGAGYLAARFNPYLRLKGFAVRDILPCALATRVGVVTQNTIRNDDFQRPLFEYTTDEVAGRGCDWLPCRSSVSVRHASDGVFVGVWSPAGYCLTKTAGDGGVLRTIKVSGYEDLAATALNKTKHSLGDVTFTTRFELSLTTSGIFNSSDTVIARASLPKAGKKDKGADSTADGEDDEAATAEPKDAKKKKAKKGKRHHYVTLPVPAWTFKGKPLPLTSEDLAASKAAVAAIDRLEANARLAALAKNDLETLVLDLKGDAATTHADVLKTVQDITEWLDKRGNDDDCPASEYEAQRAALSAAIAKSKGLPTDEL